MANELDIMLGSLGDRDASMQQALTSGLRRKREIGQLAQLTGDKVLAPFGSQLASSVDREVLSEVSRREKKDQRELTESYYSQMAEQSALANTMALRKQKEVERHNREAEAISRAAAERARTAGGFKAPTVSAQKKTQEAKESYEGLVRVIGGWKPEYGTDWGAVGAGSMVNALGKLGGTDAMQDQSRWWADYDLMYTLGRRNKLFGSALTDSEIKAWEGANISPNSPPEVIEKGLRTLAEIATKKLQEQFKNDAPLYKPDWVESMYMDISPMPQIGETPEGTAGIMEGSAPGSADAPAWGDLD